MKRLFAIRPEPGFSATRAAADLAGLEVEGEPLFEIRPLDWEPPAPEGIDGVLLGSANAVRHAGGTLALFAGKPAFAVGLATADAARKAGLSVAATGEGGLQALLDSLAGQEAVLLRLTGADHVPVVPPRGITLLTRAAYESVALPIPSPMAELLAEGGTVLLHSAAAARHFAAECDRLAIPRHALALAALAPRIADAAGGGWAAVRAAPRPRESALLAMARDMCH